MTDKELELLQHVYFLGDLISRKDWATASVVWERLLAMHAPLAQDFPHVERALSNEAGMIALAERMTSKIH